MQLNDRKLLLTLVLTIIMAYGLVSSPKYSGLILMGALIVFGGISLFWKDAKYKLIGLSAVVILSLLNMSINGLKYGIDFSGGTRIPVVLEKSVDQKTMNELVQIIKSRASFLALSEVKVRSVGDSEIDVEIPSSDPEQIKFIEEVLSHQGVYNGVVDGQIAISGENIYRNSITPQSSQQTGADWGVAFSVDKEGAETFAKTVKGKANYPLYMFLDRPNDIFLLISSKDLAANQPIGSSEQDLLSAVNRVLKLEGNSIPVILLENLDNSTLPNKSSVMVSSALSESVKTSLKENGLKLIEKTPESMKPSFTKSKVSEYIVTEWEAVGLLSAPLLSPAVTEGTFSNGYVITGQVQSTGDQKLKDVNENIKRIESVLKGGLLPVQISLGNRTVLPASLGLEFLNISLIGIVISLVLISLFIGIRYRRINVILPIVGISISELIILIAILGSFTIDLPAMAGIIAAIGVGVDAQIVITDEVLKKDGKLQEHIENAFYIIKTNVIVAICAMVPLLFSGLTEIIGFAISTMLGALLGYMLSRPAYAFVVERIVEN